MNREKIEKAAKEYTLEAAKMDVEWGDRIDLSLCSVTNSSFVAGAEWRINAVWHDARAEVPERLRFILVEKDDGKFTLNIANGKMSSCPMFWVRYAYVSDLLPEIKEDAQ